MCQYTLVEWPESALVASCLYIFLLVEDEPSVEDLLVTVASAKKRFMKKVAPKMEMLAASIDANDESDFRFLVNNTSSQTRHNRPWPLHRR